MTALDIPSDALVILVGAAGSGKSTLAARHFPADAILSSDRYREAVSGDASDQSATDEAFERLDSELDERLRAGTLTVVDATNVQPWARKRLLRVARAHGHLAILADSALTAREWGADGLYGAPRALCPTRGLLALATAHSLREIAEANRARADAVENLFREAFRHHAARRGVKHERRGVRGRKPVAQPVETKISDRRNVNQNFRHHHEQDGQQQQLSGEADARLSRRPKRTVDCTWSAGCFQIRLSRRFASIR